MGNLSADYYFNENSQYPLKSNDYYQVVDNGIDTTPKQLIAIVITISGVIGIPLRSGNSGC